jgi:patatin-related protein
MASTSAVITQEVRLAVVMYGGVSLAIYINGVAQELLRMVRATAPIGEAGGALSASKLKGSEKVYRKLSGLLGRLATGWDAQQQLNLDEVPDEAPTRFVIDTISGTSAGGINGIFLGKALANGQNLDGLQRLWVREGAIEKLINDAMSEDPPLSVIDPPTALLNGQRMYFELLKAFESMESSSAASCDSNSSAQPLVDELDLFVTATDLRGITLPLRLADEVVFERRHKNVFRFVYSSGEEPRNDFTAKNNAFLAFAARCTSSFPFAFEPMTLNDIDAVLDVHELQGGENQQLASNSSEWKPFFRSYSEAKGPRPVPLTRRSFADGGDLDNKPFSYAIDTLSRRHADVPVQRKLIYIEPSPEHPEDEVELDRKPNFIENVLDALTSLPRYETIREDLQRIVDRNRIIERLNRVVYNVEEDEQRAKQFVDVGLLKLKSDREESWAKEVLSDSEWASLDLTDMIRRKGRSYLAYHRMEIAATTDELATLIARVAGLDEESDYILVIRALVRAWRDKAFTAHHDIEKHRTLNAFLNSFDLSYSLRRISFLQRKADFLFRLDQKSIDVLKRQAIAPWREEGTPSADEATEFRDELCRIKIELKRQHDSLRKLGRNLRSRHRPEQTATSVGTSQSNT